MHFLRNFVFILFFLKYNLSIPIVKEPMCSKFPYEEQLLEKMIRQEINVEMMQNGIEKTQETISNTLEEIKKTDVIVAKTLESLQNNFTDLSEKTSQDLEKNEEALRITFDDLRNNLTKEIEEQRKIVTGFKQDIEQPSVAFFAHNVEDLKLDKTDKIIVFTTATTNEGSGYDTSTGIFTAPVGGIYQFIVKFCSPIKMHSPLALVMSGNVIASSSNYDDDHHTCSSFSAVIRVGSRETIWVKCILGSLGYALRQDGWRMNSFSGILINNLKLTI